MTKSGYHVPVAKSELLVLYSNSCNADVPVFAKPACKISRLRDIIGVPSHNHRFMGILNDVACQNQIDGLKHGNSGFSAHIIDLHGICKIMQQAHQNKQIHHEVGNLF